MTSNSGTNTGAFPQRQKQQEQRLHKRSAVLLDAVCALPDGLKQPCRIQDFCVGGMFLQYLSPDRNPANHPDKNLSNNIRLPGVGDIIEVSSNIQEKSGTTEISFKAKIVHTNNNSAGIAFVEPDLASLQIIQDYIIRHAGEQKDRQNYELSPGNSTSSSTPLSTSETKIIVEDCKYLVKDYCRDFGSTFLKVVIDHLFKLAETAKNNNEQSEYFAAMGVFNKDAEILSKAFSRNLHEKLEATSDSPLANEINYDATPKKNELSLMEDDVLEDWLANKNVINFITGENSESLSELEGRLTTLFKEEVDDLNNPFSPSVIAQSFDSALMTVHIEHNIKLTALTIFKDLIASDISKLYKNINRLLSDNGINIHLQIKTPPVENEQAKESKANLEQQNKYNEDGNNSNSQVSDAESQNQNDNTRNGQDIFKLAQELRQLKSQLSKYTGHYDPDKQEQSALSILEPDTNTSPINAENLYSVNDVLSALSALQNIKTNDHNGDNSIKSRLIEHLSNNPAIDDNKVLDTREYGIIDVTNNVFSSLHKDMLVANNVRQWIKKLEIPLLKVALNDDKLFTDKSHATRQVVNKISQLELYGETEDHVGQSAIRTKIDRLLDKICSDVDVNPMIFAQTLKELDVIIQIQNSAYDENLQEVIVSYENKQYNPDRSRPILSEAEKTTTEEFQCWITRIHRLKIDSWLLISSDDQSPHRVRLGWISKNRERYVFVNLKGIKDTTLSDTELANEFMNGNAVILENADEPALDRAQYSMLQNLHEQLLHETTHDPLTGLLNRREFEHYLHEFISDIKDDTSNYTLCHIDINQFKLINNTCGFEGGDTLLKEISGQINGMLKEQATIARIGSDQFAMLLNNVTQEEASELWQLQLDSLNGYRFTWKDKRLTVSFSIGIVPVSSAHINVTKLLQSAEACCKTAKDKGCNSIYVYQPDDETSTQRQRLMDWVVRIDKAIDENKLELRYQPIVPISQDKTTHPHHAEILLKVMDEDGNTISPQEFVLAAEQYNRMPAIDRWVIEKTFKWISDHNNRMNEIGGFAINLSGKTLNDKTTLPFVLNLLDNPGINTDWICFEVTETAGIDNLSDATEFIEKIKETGVKFSLDDFGSGLSSYAYLKNLPVDYLKIDGAFIKEIDKNPSDYAVVKSICEIGHFMGKKIIAEYVENDSILEKLREIGIDYAQGYGIQKPRDLTAL